MKKMRCKEVTLKCLSMILAILLFVFFMQFEVNAKVENEDEILVRIQKENEDNPESTKYLITDEKVSNIPPKTSIQELKENIIGEVKVYEDNTKQSEVTSGIIKTGMLLEYLENNRNFDVSVLGDLNKDGILNQIELTREIRDIVNSEGWDIEDDIEVLSGDITKDKKIDLEDTEAIINYIVFDKLETVEYEKVIQPEVVITSGDLNNDRYESDVEIAVKEKQENSQKTVYKITGSAEREYKEIDKNETIKIETDGVFKVTAYTYGKDGNKSKGKAVILIREKPTYVVKYSAGTQGTFNTQEIDKLYMGDDTPQFNGDIVGNPGYKFVGWSEDIKEKVDGSIEYVAKWEPIEYKIEYNLNGGSLLEGEENPTTYNIETESFTLKNPTKFGYKFLGWSENESEEIKENVTIEIGTIGDKKYTAKWEALSGIPYTVKTYTMDINGVYQEEIVEYRGTTDEEINLETSPNPGFTYEEELSIPTGIINPDGSTELKLYFSRNKYSFKVIAGYGIESIEFKKITDEEATSSNIEIVEDIYYEMPITISANEKIGYTWEKWTSNNSELVSDSRDKIYEFTMPIGNLELTAGSTLNTYTLEYELNGGNLEEGKENPTTYTVETETFTLNNPVKQGYTFIGWTVNGGEQLAEELIVEQGTVGNFVLKANYTPNTDTLYTVVVHRMNTEGVYEIEMTEEKHGTTDEEVTLEIEDEIGFTFDADRSNITGRILPDGSLVLNVYFARNKYNLLLNKETGVELDGCESGTYYYGETINLNTIITNGYTWNEWRSEDTEFNSSNKEYSITMPAKNLALLATVTVNIYDITYDLAGGSVQIENPATYTVETERFTLNNPEKIGYVFVGWTGSNGSNPEKQISIERGSIGDKNYIANWTEATGTKYRIKVYKMDTSGNYGEPVSNNEYSGTTNAQISANTTADVGFTYDNTRGKINGTIAPDGSTVLEVYFSRNKYKLTLAKLTGITAVTGENTYYYEQQVTIDATVATGYSWSKWTSSNSALIAESTNKRHTITIPASDMTLTAYATINQYTLTRTAETGGTVSGSAGSINYNTSCTVTATASTGYSFEGWYSGTTKVSSSASYTFNMPASNYSLVAKFTVNKYTLTRTAETGGSVGGSSGSISYGTSCTVTATASTGYSFAGWYNGTTKVSTSASYTFNMPASNYSLVAKFTLNKYTLTRTAETGGSVSGSSGSISYGTSCTVTATASTGYSFAGWYSGTTKVSSAASYTFNMPANNYTLVAKFKKITYTITYNANGGTGAPSAQTKTHGTALTLSTTEPTRTDYIFVGWSTSQSATTATYKAGGNYTTEGNATLYAVWKYGVITGAKSTSGKLIYCGGYGEPTSAACNVTVPANAEVSMSVVITNNNGQYGTYTVKFNGSTVANGSSSGASSFYTDTVKYTTTQSGTITLSLNTNSIGYGNNYYSAVAYMNIDGIIDKETGKPYILR